MPIEKVFVYNGDHTSLPCVEDATAFFTAHGVFGKPDVRLTRGIADNFSGLDPSKMALVIPGGAALKMSWTLEKLPTIAPLLNAGAHYVGFCAGAYLALNAVIYANSYKVIDGSFELPRQMILEGNAFSFKLSEEYCAVGPFYPDFNYYVDWQKQYHGAYTPAQFCNASKPYATELLFDAGRHVTLPALYVAGCGFKLRNRVENEMRVLAAYPQQSYRFSNFTASYHSPYVTETIETIPAIIAREPNVEKKQGGVFLSGPHLEASVPNSSMIRFFSTRTEGRILLTEEKLELLEKNREALQSEAVRLVNGNFGYR